MIKKGNFISAFAAHCLAALMLMAATMATAQELTARVDRNKVSVDDTFTLIIRSTAMSVFDSPDLTPLEQDFEVLGSSRNSQHSIINGKTQSSLEWHISLAAKREGALVIPPITVDGRTTQAIIIEASKSSFAQNNAGFEPVFIESELDSDTLYVQAQLLLTVRIYYAVALERGAQLSDLELEHAVVKQINEAAYETKVKNMSYNVHEVKYAIFPQRSGQLQIPAQTFSALLASRRRGGSPFSNFGSVRRGRPINVESETHSVEVLPQAPSYTGKTWLPASKLSLIESWSKELSELKAGEPITRSIFVESIGLQGSQIPPLALQDIQGAQQYPDQPETADEDSSLGVTGTRIESVAIIPAGGGKLRLPEVTLHWWNTHTNQQEVATIPAQTLIVAGPPLTAADPVSSPQDATDKLLNSETAQTSGDSAAALPNAPSGKFWQYSTWLALLLWLATLAYFMWLKPPTTPKNVKQKPKDNSKTAWAQLETVVGEGKPAAIREALIEWARQHTGQQNISALSGIASHFHDMQLSQQLVTLDAAIYNGGSSQASNFNADRLLSALQSALNAEPKTNANKTYELEPLYRA